MKTRVLIADDHPIVRSGIRAELTRHLDFQIVGEAVTADEVIQLVSQTATDIIILDISMPGIKAAEVIKRIGKGHPDTKILVLTAHGDKGTIMSMLKAGAHGYVLKDEDPEVVPDAIRTVMSGKNWVSPSVTTLMVGKLRDGKPKSNSGVLTEREIEVIRLIADGLTTKDIASRLNIADRTVEFNVSNIYDKLGVNTRGAIVNWAQENDVL